MRKSIFVFLMVYMATFCNDLLAQNNKAIDLNLLPWPNEVKLTSGKHIISKDFYLSISGNPDDRIFRAASSFLDRIDNRTGLFFVNKNITEEANSSTSDYPMKIIIERPGKLELFEDESYSLQINPDRVVLKSATDLGAMHGLETLLQLIASDKDNFFFPAVSINDSPRFPWRGLMFDVARHYLPMEILKRNIDAMAAVKLNVFHWHLSDDQGFRVEVKSYPKLHELASDGLFYTQNQIKEIVAYAADRGIRVIPEIDVPGHATAILAAYPELGSKDMAYTVERNKGVFDATLDPTNEATYAFLDAVITEVSKLFPDNYFHIGGDENKGKHWNENKTIQQFKKDNNFKDNHELQTYFNVRVQKFLKKNNKVMMGWDEIFEPGLPKDIVIHSWRGKEAMISAAKKGYKSVLSKGYYIDLLFDTKTHYEQDPIPANHGLTSDEIKNILGGEATMWGELVGPPNVDSRVWPRTAAIAERFWSDATVNDFDQLVPRLNAISLQLEEHGLTHIKSRNAVLRNLFKTYEIEPFVTLAEICSPMTARERVGKPYKTFHPFTLFVDACTPDSPKTIYFNSLVRSYNENSNAKNEINDLLNKWQANHLLLLEKDASPTLAGILPFSEALAELSSLYLQKMNNSEKFNSQEQDKIDKLLSFLNTPSHNVRLAITNDLKILSEKINKQ